MFRKTISILISILVIACITLPVTASMETDTFKDKVNAIELKPMRETWPFGGDNTLIKRVDNAVKGKTTNYDKLLDVYNDVVNDANLNAARKQGNNCAAYARKLYDAMTILGFRPYEFRGNITTVNGGWTAHSWIGLDVGSALYFLDSFMSASGSKGYFLMSQKSATMYDLKSAELWQCDVGTGLVANSVLLTKVDTTAKRKKYGPVLDMYRETDWLYRTYKDQFKKGGTFENDEYFVTGDKRGNVITVYRNGTMVVETKAENKTRTNQEFQERDEKEKRRQWNEKYRDKFGEYDEVFDENGNLRNPDKYKKAS